MHDQMDVVKLLRDADANPYTEDKLGGYVLGADTRVIQYTYFVTTAPPLT